MSGRERVADYLAGTLSEAEHHRFELELDRDPALRAEVAELAALWQAVGRLPDPEPSAQLRQRFDDMLAAYRHGMQEARRGAPVRASLAERLSGMWQSLWPTQPVWQAATALLLLGVGFAGGQYRNAPATKKNEIAQLQGEVASMRQMVTLSLLQQQSAADRLRGVNWAYRLERPAEEVNEALLDTVTQDPNINVRMAAVEVLGRLGSDERVQKSLVNAIPAQDSPLVQMALIDALVQMKPAQAGPVLQRISQDPQANPAVRDRAAQALRKIRFE